MKLLVVKYIAWANAQSNLVHSVGNHTNYIPWIFFEISKKPKENFLLKFYEEILAETRTEKMNFEEETEI